MPAHTHPLQKHVVRYKKVQTRRALATHSEYVHGARERGKTGRLWEEAVPPLAQAVDGLAVKLLWYTPLLHTKLTTAARGLLHNQHPPCVARTCGASPPLPRAAVSHVPIEHGVERLRLRHPRWVMRTQAGSAPCATPAV